MSKWYKIEACKKTCESTVLIQEHDGKVYEKYVIDYKGNSWKCSKELIFHAASSSERLEKFKLENAKYIEEITEGDAFAIIL